MFKNKNNQIRAGWYILAAFIIMYVGQFIFSLPGSVLLVLMQMDLGSQSVDIVINPEDLAGQIFENPLLLLFVQGAGTFGGLAATLIAWRALNKKQPLDIGLRGSGLDFVFGLFLGAASIIFISLLLLVTGQVKMMNDFLSPEFSIFTLVFLVIFILTGFFEEIFFRGYVMKTMVATGNKRWVIYVVSAIVFSLVHLTNPNISWLGIINIAFVGILFAYMFDVTKSLWLPIGYHITWNYFQGSVFEFPVSGLTTNGLYKVDISHGHDLLTGGTFGLEGGLMATIFIALGFIATYLYAKKRHGDSGSLI